MDKIKTKNSEPTLFDKTCRFEKSRILEGKPPFIKWEFTKRLSNKIKPSFGKLRKAVEMIAKISVLIVTF